MPQRWRKILLSLLAAPVLFTACNRNFSSDNPITPSYIPSIIINSDNMVVYALDPTTGLKNWQCALPISASTPLGTELPIHFQPSPLVYGGMVYMAGTQTNPVPISDTIYKINSSTGTLIKKIYLSNTSGIGNNVQATPIADANLIYVATTDYGTTGGTIYAIDTGTYVVKWSYSAGSPIVSSPTIYNGQVYFATTGGTVFCLDKTLGTLTWNYTPPISAGSVPATFYSSPSICAPYLYIGSVADSNMYCIKLTSSTTTGVERWRYKTNGAIYSSPAANYGVCVFGSSDFNVYCLDTFLIGTATVPGARWVKPTSSAVESSPVINNGTVYIGSFDYNLYAFDIIHGNLRWKFASTSLIKSSPIVYGNSVYVASYDKYLYSVDTASGTLKWSYNTNGQIQCSPAIEDLSHINQNNSQISGFTN